MASRSAALLSFCCLPWFSFLAFLELRGPLLSIKGESFHLCLVDCGSYLLFVFISSCICTVISAGYIYVIIYEWNFISVISCSFWISNVVGFSFSTSAIC